MNLDKYTDWIDSLLYPLIPEDYAVFSPRSERNAVKRINQKIKRGIIPTKIINCLCTSKDFVEIYSKDRRGILNTSVICKNCGLIQSNPRLIDYEIIYNAQAYKEICEKDEISKNIEEELFVLFFQQDFENSEEESFNRPQINDIYNNLKPYIDKNHQKILDFGCSSGYNLIPFF
jgi:hypothetical protein